MKENVEKNETFVKLFELHKEFYDNNPDECRKQVGEKLGIDRHAVRAWICRLADPSRFKGKYVARIAPFKGTKVATAGKTNTAHAIGKAMQDDEESFQCAKEFYEKLDAKTPYVSHKPWSSIHHKKNDHAISTITIAAPIVISAEELGELEDLEME